MGTIKLACRWCEELRPLAMFLISLFCIALFAYGLYTLRLWYMDTTPIVEFFGGEISAPTARADDTLVVYINVRKHRECPGITQRRLTGDCGEHLLSEAHTYRPGGFVGRVTLPFQVPHAAIPGDCAFQTHVWFVCNPFDMWRERHYASPPIAFKVLRYDE